MPTINLDQTLKNTKGQEFKDGDKPIELGSTLLWALEQKSQGQDMKESMSCYELRKRIFKGGEVSLSSEDIILLKAKCHEAISQPAFFAVIDILEA